jgi:hypothetical protein
MNTIEFIFIVIVIYMSFVFGNNIGYKNGQIDAINGQVNYHLEKQPNGEMEWIKIK